MKKLEVNQMENLEGGKFWGTGEWTAMGSCTNGHQTVYQNTYALWFVVEREYNIIDC